MVQATYELCLICLVGSQVSALCDGKDGAINPYVILDSTNQTVNTDAQYHDFRAYMSNDYRPDWYYEIMIWMRCNFRKGFMGYQPEQIHSLAKNGRAVAVYNGMVYDLMDYINFVQTACTIKHSLPPPLIFRLH